MCDVCQFPLTPDAAVTVLQKQLTGVRDVCLCCWRVAIRDMMDSAWAEGAAS